MIKSSDKINWYIGMGFWETAIIVFPPIHPTETLWWLRVYDK
jgi:hypothetical protein